MPNVINAPNPRWIVIDNLGKPAAFGYVYTYDNNTRKPLATYKDAAGKIPHQNPLQLDGKGEAVIYWQDGAVYYIEVYDGLKERGGNLIYTQENYPKVDVSSGGGSVTVNIDTINLVRNPQFSFWDNGTSFSSDELGTFSFTANDWIFERSNTASTCSVDRREFSLGQTEVSATPQYYFEFNCNAIGAGGETFKRIKQVFDGVQTLNNTEIAIQFFARYTSVPTSIEVSFYQFFGTGGAPSPTVKTLALSQSLTTTWTQYTATVTLPSIAGKVLGDNGDDSLWLSFDLPLNALSNVQIANVQIERGNVATPFEFATSDKEKAFLLQNFDNGINILDLGADNTGVGDVTPYFNRALEISKTIENKVIIFPAGTYRFFSKPNLIDENVKITGVNKDSTIILKDYNEASLTNGLLEIDNSVSGNVAIEVSGLIFHIGDGSSVGTIFSGIASPTATINNLIFSDIDILSPGSGTLDRAFHIDGSASSCSSILLSNINCLSSTSSPSFLFKSVSNSVLNFSSVTGADFTGNDASTPSKNIITNIRGFGSTINFDFCSDINVFTSGVDSVTNTSNSNRVSFYGNVLNSVQKNGNLFNFLGSKDFEFIPPNSATHEMGMCRIAGNLMVHYIQAYIIPADLNSFFDFFFRYDYKNTGYMVLVYVPAPFLDNVFLEIKNTNSIRLRYENLPGTSVDTNILVIGDTL